MFVLLCVQNCVGASIVQEFFCLYRRTSLSLGTHAQQGI